MDSSSTNQTAQRTAALLTLGAFATVALAVSIPIPSPKPGPLWVVLPMLAFLAECIPVELSRRGLRVTFTLPYVVGMALVAGPVGAIATEVVATTLVSLLRHKRKGLGVSPSYVVINAAIAAIGCAAGASALLATNLYTDRVELQALAFGAVYSVCNFVLVAYVDWLTARRSFSDNVLASLSVGVKSVFFYALIVSAVALLVSRGMIAFVPLTLVPVWAIRTGLHYQAELYDHYYETITALNLMLQRAHPYTHGHLERVSATAEEVARKLGLSSARARLVREAAVLHDVGKIAVDEMILDKPSRLTDEEMSHVRKHAEWGAEILSPVKQFGPIVPWIRHHHERPDGQGYPSGLAGNQIPIESRIIAVVDAFDAMTDTQDGAPGRPYRKPMTVRDAIEELERHAGTQFDVAVVQAFREVVVGGDL